VNIIFSGKIPHYFPESILLVGGADDWRFLLIAFFPDAYHHLGVEKGAN
jgi:hypothetical protein